MFQRLILLWGACLALVLSISSCGGDSEDFKPVNKTGALDGGAPDVILFVLVNWNGSDYPAGPRSTNIGPQAGGVTFSAAYARYADDAQAYSDLLSLGRSSRAQPESDEPKDAVLFRAMEKGGYTTRIMTSHHLESYLAEETTGPRFALVEMFSEGDRLISDQALLAVKRGAERERLTVWTAMPAASNAEALTEEQLHVPLVFSMPGTLPDKQVHTQVVCLADVGVTILDLCGLLPEGTERNDNEGASFARILQKKPLAWRGFVLAKTASGDGWIRSTRWRLSHSVAKGLTLSHIEEDPSNTRDDSNLPGANAQLEGLGRRLDAWLK